MLQLTVIAKQQLHQTGSREGNDGMRGYATSEMARNKEVLYCPSLHVYPMESCKKKVTIAIKKANGMKS